MKIAILGLGTIGGGVMDIIEKRGLPLTVIKIWDRVINSKYEALYAHSLEEILEDPTIEVIVETMGGEAYAYKAIQEAMRHKKSVVTANKEVISRYGEELTALKNEMGVELAYEASVGGGIPIIRPLYHIKQTNDINRIEGILNGTTNFILTRMERKETFEEALLVAQQLGFAESNPTNDIEGLDALRKIAILGMIATNQRLDYRTIPHAGMKHIKLDDIEYLKHRGYTVKMIATLDGLFASVEPVAVENHHLLSQIKNENNAIIVSTNYYQDLTFIGKGAGRYPTACAMIDDLLALQNHQDSYSLKLDGSFVVEDRPHSYYCRMKRINGMPSHLIESQEGHQIITKPIFRNQLNQEDIYFYARIRKEDANV